MLSTLPMNPIDSSTKIRAVEHLPTHLPVILLVRFPVDTPLLVTILSASSPCTQFKMIGTCFRWWVPENLTRCRPLKKHHRSTVYSLVVVQTRKRSSQVHSRLPPLSPLIPPLRSLTERILARSSLLRREGSTDHSIGLCQ